MYIVLKNKGALTLQKFSICPLASGSKGNSYLITNGKTNILLDLGISFKALKEGLCFYGKSTDDINAIVVTHEHTDHIKGIGTAARRHKIPVYATLETWRGMYQSLCPIPDDIVKVVEKNNPFYIDDIKITAFSISHDARDPVGYSFFFGGKKISAATDTGVANEEIFQNLKGSGIALIEANHDRNMLMMGKYPLSLKNRIKGTLGHLSNDDAGALAVLLAKSGTKKMLLGHLSEENNYPDLAKLTVETALKEKGCLADLWVVCPHCHGEIFSL